MIQEDDETSSEDESHPFQGWAPFSHSGISNADENTSDDDDLGRNRTACVYSGALHHIQMDLHQSGHAHVHYMRLLVRNLYEEEDMFDSMRYYDPNDIPPQPLPAEKADLVLQPPGHTNAAALLRLPGGVRARSGSRGLPCGHAFHTSCITQWFAQSAACPVCRTDFAGYTPPPPPSPTPPPKRPTIYTTYRRRR